MLRRVFFVKYIAELDFGGDFVIIALSIFRRNIENGKEDEEGAHDTSLFFFPSAHLEQQHQQQPAGYDGINLLEFAVFVCYCIIRVFYFVSIPRV